MKQNYILVSACKNEAENLPSMILSVSSQKIKPLVWLIVDDGSTDGSSAIIESASKKFDWIIYIKMPEGKRDLGFHYSTILKTGFDTAIDYCHINNLEYSYLGNVDCDLTFNDDFFSNIIEEFNTDNELGVASGGTLYTINNKKVRAKIRKDEPSGGHMLIRKECYDDISGVKVSYSADTVIKAKARMKGWNTRRFEENTAIEIRDVSSSEGYWKGYVFNGKSNYFLNFNFIHVLFKSALLTLRRPYFIGMAYFYGYLSSLVNHDQKIDDADIRNYFNSKWKYVFFNFIYNK